jgi:hypothetical protein
MRKTVLALVVAAVGTVGFGISTVAAQASEVPQVRAAAPVSISVLLADDINFDDTTGGTQSVAGAPGTCANLFRPNVTSSASPFGGKVKLFSARDCKGKSVVIKGDVADLGKLNFDNKAVSVLFG